MGYTKSHVTETNLNWRRFRNAALREHRSQPRKESYMLCTVISKHHNLLIRRELLNLHLGQSPWLCLTQPLCKIQQCFIVLGLCCIWASQVCLTVWRQWWIWKHCPVNDNIYHQPHFHHWKRVFVCGRWDHRISVVNFHFWRNSIDFRAQWAALIVIRRCSTFKTLIRDSLSWQFLHSLSQMLRWSSN